jgi:Acyl-CoA carboxylase epsilon subunit
VTPHLRILRGTPTPEELAALVAVLTTRARPADPPPPAPHPLWNDHARRLGLPRPGPTAWRASTLPR